MKGPTGRHAPQRPEFEEATMALTFRKSFRILPGVRLNINRRSWSVTTGGAHGPRRTVGSDGRRTTSMDLPGPFGYRHTSTRSSRRRSTSRRGGGR